MSLGALSLALPLDREDQSVLSLTVLARDSGTPSRSSSLSVRISVLDVNDNVPHLSSTSSNQLIPVSEDVPPGSPIFTVEAADADAGNNGTVRFSLDQDAQSHFRIDPATGKIFTSLAFDYEQTSSYPLTVTAVDQGDVVQLSSSLHLTVSLLDVNDNAPEIVSGPTVVLDPASSSEEIYRLRARDRDSGLNAKLRYGFRSGGADSRHFRLDADSGALSLRTPRRELTQGEYRLEFEVSDSATPSLRKTTTGSLVVLKLAERRGPEFSQATYHASITENSPVGTPIGHVTNPGNGKDDVQYIMEAAGEENHGDLFTVDAASGQVRSKREIDREEDGDQISLNIFAVSTAWSSVCKVRDEWIHVDENVFLISPDLFSLKSTSWT